MWSKEGYCFAVICLVTINASPYMLVIVTNIKAVGKIPVEVDKLTVDMLTIAGHKLYAPKG